MGHRLDHSNKAFMYFKLSGLQDKLKRTKILPSEVRAFRCEEEEVRGSNTTSSTAQSLKQSGKLYRCRKCRQVSVCILTF